MAWSYDVSLSRAQDRYKDTEGLQVRDVTRQTDFDSISLKEPRRVRGAHFYVDVSNYTALLGTPSEGTDEDMLRLLHVYAREVTRIVESDFDATKVHFQGARLHAISYRPIGQDSKMIAKAVLAASAIRATAAIFNEVFDLPDGGQWSVVAGIDFGETIATKNGTGGDRELLFLGAPANYAAKMIESSVRISSDAADLLPDEFAPSMGATASPAVKYVSFTPQEIEDLADSYGWTWSQETSRRRLEDAANAYPQSVATVKNPTVKIDKTKLALSNSKRLWAISLFADVDGFTSYIDQAAAVDSDLTDAVRAFHALRAEMRATAVVDYEALRIQYQGDRMQVIVYLPFGEQETAAMKALRLAASLQSVASQIMPQVVAASAAKPLAIGLSAGEILLSKLGEQGERDVVALGPSVVTAAGLQQGLDGTDIGMDKPLRDLLPPWAQGLLVWTGSAYVATALTLEELDRQEAAAQLQGGASSVKGVPSLISGTAAHNEPALRPYVF